MLKLDLQYFAGSVDTWNIYVKSNDGSTQLFNAWSTSNTTVTITESGFTLSGGTIYGDGSTYTYEGNKTLLGFATSANATEPTYTTGDTLTLTADGVNMHLYIVEGEAEPTTSGVTVEYNSSVVATIPSGNTAALPVKDKKMKSDIVISVPESDGATIPEFTEVEDFAVFVESEDEGELTIGYSVSQDVKLPNGTHRLGVIAYEGEEPNLISKTITENGTYKASEEVQDELAGTWLLNQTIAGWSGSTTEFTLSGLVNTCDGNNNYVEGANITSLSLSQTNSTTFFQVNSDLIYINSDLGFPVEYSVYNYYYRNYGTYNGYISIENGNSKTVSPSSADGLLLRTFTITSKLSEVTDGDVLLAWLKVNATKQPAPAIDGYSEVVVNVEATDSPLPIEVSTEAEMTELLESGEVGGVYKYTGETTDAYENGALYVLEAELITFTVNSSITHQAEEGMTWYEWCQSDYNDDGYTCAGEDAKVYTSGTSVYLSVLGADVIVDGANYTTIGSGGSNE